MRQKFFNMYIIQQNIINLWNKQKGTLNISVEAPYNEYFEPRLNLDNLLVQ